MQEPKAAAKPCLTPAEIAVIDAGFRPARFGWPVRMIRRLLWPFIRPFHFETLRILADSLGEQARRIDELSQEVAMLRAPDGNAPKAPQQDSPPAQAADINRVSDAVWRRMAQTAPYWAVMSMDEFAGEITPEVEQKFFDTGEALVQSAVERMEALYPGIDAPHVAIDFGCGLGRLTRPLARRAGHVYAVDISADMLRMCVENCAKAGLHNVTPVASDDQLQALAGMEADLILTSITFQHIRPARGMIILDSLLRRLKAGGVAHLFILVAGISNILPDLPGQERIERHANDMLEMNVYPAADLMALFSRYADAVHFTFVPTGGQLGADIVLRRTA